MEASREYVESNDQKVVLNIGCGFRKMEGAINIDAYDTCNPDMILDLNETPWPWDDDSVDEIKAFHIMEHIPDWWGAFTECARILKPEGTLEIRVPHSSSDTALSYRDHLHIFTRHSFDGTLDALQGRLLNAWFATQNAVPLIRIGYILVPFEAYWWMTKWWSNWMLRFCANHLRNFIWEQRFIFQKKPIADYKMKIAGKIRNKG